VVVKNSVLDNNLKLMRAFKNLYYLVSFSLLIAQIAFVSFLLYNKIVLGKVLYYGNADKPIGVSGHFFNGLRFLLYSTFTLMIVWALLTPLAVISNKRRVNDSDHIDVAIGFLGFAAAVILLFVDPFGIFKWFTGE
jgi:hypothetical protein